jgi:hypothetical protein
VTRGEKRVRHRPADAAGGAGQKHHPALLGRRRHRRPYAKQWAGAYCPRLPIVEYVGFGKSRGDCMSGLRIYGIARTRAFRALWVAEELGLSRAKTNWQLSRLKMYSANSSQAS